MNRILASLLSVAWWLVPLAVVAAVLGWETDWGSALRPSPPTPEPVVAKPVAAEVLPDYAIAGGLAARPETTGRTLFNPTRRPAPALVAEAPKPTMRRGQFTLTGTLVVDGKSTAFLREVAGGKSRRVLQGETINGLLVADVQPDRVKLALGDESEDLILKVVPNPKPTVAAAPVAPPAGVPAGVQPGAPPPPPPVAASGQPATQSAGDLIARRRAAREAAAAQAAPGGGAPAAPANADQQWSEVYQRYQQRGR